jgi:hypothetical protein
MPAIRSTQSFRYLSSHEGGSALRSQNAPFPEIKQPPRAVLAMLISALWLFACFSYWFQRVALGRASFDPHPSFYRPTRPDRVLAVRLAHGLRSTRPLQHFLIVRPVSARGGSMCPV